MKSNFETLLFKPNQSILVTDFRGFAAPFSHHPELELVLIVEGEGARFIDQTAEPFSAGDLVLIGPNLPHWWRPKVEGGDPVHERAIVIQYLPSLWDNLGDVLPELKELSNFLEMASHGIHLDADHHVALIEKIMKLPNLSSSRQVLLSLEILIDVMESQHRRTICSVPWNKLKVEGTIEKAIRYIQTHLHLDIQQKEVAEQVGVTPVHLSRLFKESVRMSFPDYLHRIRIDLISKQLLSPKVNIANCAFENGYQNLSSFNRAFKKQLGMTPGQFRKKMMNL